jgi:N-acetylmuramoyl-L-alanine amidase
MIKRYALGAIILTVILSLSGCGDEEVLPRPSYSSVTYTQKQDLISVDLLASSLGMQVAEQNNTHITLKDGANTVMLFTHRGGKYFVNGNEGGTVGEINNISGTYYVSQLLVEQIRGKLTPGAKSNIYSKYLSGTVVIDPGHGGKDTGAISVKGFYEKTVNLSVARKVAARLKKRGIKVVMTRTSDTYPELNERADIANRINADLFVSIHADSAYSRGLKGFTVYIAENASYKSQKVAKSIYNRMNKIHANTKGIRRNDYRVLVRTKMPAVLVEMGYISNHHEAGMIASDSFQNKIADAIANGICDVLPGI